MPVYLIHFEQRYKHAGHYLGYTQDLEARIRTHRANQGARLLQVVNEAGIAWQVVRVWDGGYDLESAFKSWKNAPRLCPVCNPAQAAFAWFPLTSLPPGAQVPAVEALSAEAFRGWLLALGRETAVGWTDEPCDGPLEWWLDACYGGQWEVRGGYYRWREGNGLPWWEWLVLPAWAVVVISTLYERYGNVLVSAGQVLEVLAWSLQVLEQWQRERGNT